MKKMKSLHSLFLGTISVSYAYYSRSYPAEIAEILGSHDNRALLEHLVAGATIPHIGNALHYFGFDKNELLFGLTGIYTITSVIWEYLQYTQRGFYQLDQTVADFAGVCLGLMILKYCQKKDDLLKEVNTDG